MCPRLLSDRVAGEIDLSGRSLDEDRCAEGEEMMRGFVNHVASGKSVVGRHRDAIENTTAIVRPATARI